MPVPVTKEMFTFYPSVAFMDCNQACHRKRIIASCCAFKLNLVPLVLTCRERMHFCPYIAVISHVMYPVVIVIADVDAGVDLEIRVDV
jgi:hypothetical protein